MCIRHRLCRFRKNKHLRHQRFRSRIFHRDSAAISEMKKPFVVVLTVAGISAESGIRTFRAADGLWEEHQVEDVATPEGYRRDPELVQAFYNTRRRQLQQPDIAPNAAHFALADLEAALGDNFVLVTQNIDNLHERTGSKRVIHMHGELLKVRCTQSGQVLDWPGDLSADERVIAANSLLRCDRTSFGSVKCRWGWMKFIKRLLKLISLSRSVPQGMSIQPHVLFMNPVYMARTPWS